MFSGSMFSGSMFSGSAFSGSADAELGAATAVDPEAATVGAPGLTLDAG
jgi:hypothetical protein